LQPNILVKGAEYGKADIVGGPEVESWGGQIVRVRMRQGYSTSRLVNMLEGRKSRQ